MIRILACGEFTQSVSGYAVYMKEILKRLSTVPGVEVAELASYCHVGDPRIAKSQWPVFPVAPALNDTRAMELYNSNPYMPFGRGVFNDVLVSYKPTHVIDIRDSWHMEHEFRGPLRDFYAHVCMPAVDAAPQHKSWIEMYSSADKLLSYTDWGIEVLKKHGLQNTFKSASPCAGSEYKPESPEFKKQLKASIGLGDIKIVGTVMRNQRRKLFPDLFEDFAKFLQKSGRKDVYLLCHTTCPDTWELDTLLMKHGIGNRVLFTTICRSEQCKHVDVGFYKGVKNKCSKCGEHSVMMTNIHSGIDNNTLNQIYNLMDLYVQYAICEGYGVPLAEALACGIPIMAIDYSAMSEIVHQAMGEPIKVGKMFTEPESFREMALPDSEDFIGKLEAFFTLSEEDQRAKGEFSRILYGLRSYDDAAKVWLEAIKQTTPLRSWNEPKTQYAQPSVPNTPTSNSEFARHLILNVLQEPKLVGSYLEARLIRDLNNNECHPGFCNRYYHEDGRQLLTKFDREIAFKHFCHLLEEKMIWENRR